MQWTEFIKRAANPYAFAKVPPGVLERLRPVESLVLARIIAGRATEDKAYETTTNRKIHIPEGGTWVSIESIRHDISAALVKPFTRPQIKYALRKLAEAGLIESEPMLPETKGRYGRLYRATVSLSDCTADPMTDFKIHAYGDVKPFRFGGIASMREGSSWRQRQPGDVLKLADWVGSHGSDESVFRTIGLWRDRKDVRQMRRPVFFPWFVFDVDSSSINEAYDTTRQIISDLDDAEFDTTAIVVSFSGSKGFHVAIPTWQFGSPVFRTADAGRLCLTALAHSITDTPFDPVTFSPLQMFRLTGSRHAKSGRYKRSWMGPHFRSMQLHEIVAAADEFGAWKDPDFIGRPSIAAVVERFESCAKETGEKEWQAHRQRQATARAGGVNRIGDSLKQVLVAGVSVGDRWAGGKRSGRDMAAFTISCYCIEDERQHAMVRSVLQMAQASEADDALMETLIEWNKKNDPPLSESHLKSKIAAASRYIERRK